MIYSVSVSNWDHKEIPTGNLVYKFFLVYKLSFLSHSKLSLKLQNAVSGTNYWSNWNELSENDMDFFY